MTSSALTGNTSGLASATSPGLVGITTQTFAGVKTFSGGIQLPTTGGTPATLNWYEEGTWSPSIGGTSTNFTTVTYSKQIGVFTRIGRIVHIQCYVRWTNTTGSGTGGLLIYGLPYPSKNTTDVFATISCGEWSNIDITGAGIATSLGYEISPNTQQGVLTGSGDNTVGQTVTANSNGGAVDRFIIFTGIYTV